MKYRLDNNIDTIIQDYTFVKREDCHPHYPRGWMGVDKIGRPIYIEIAGKINPTKLWENIDTEELWKAYY